ncbi:MAG: DUF998 domain-containing protein [Actinobacteria bacterium]|nr:DUF998 domain-containing protein [Actinomycetota bacterium]
MTRSRLAAFAVAGPALYVALVAILHVLEPEWNDTDALSEYALGDYGFLMNVAFVAAGFGFAALAATLVGSVRLTASARTGIVLLVVAAVGWILLGTGNVDPLGAEQTTHGRVHFIGYLLGFPSMLVALLLLARAFGRDERWRPFRRTLLTLAAAALVAFVLAFSDVASPITMRLVNALAMLAVALTAIRASKLGQA